MLNTLLLIIYNLFNFIVPAPSITVTNDTVTVDSTATLMCTSSISNISVSFGYQWTGPDNLVISGEIDGILMIPNVDVDDAGQYMCTSTASYNGSEVNTTYVMDFMNTASVDLTVKRKLIYIIILFHYSLMISYEMKSIFTLTNTM